MSYQGLQTRYTPLLDNDDAVFTPQPKFFTTSAVPDIERTFNLPFFRGQDVKPNGHDLLADLDPSSFLGLDMYLHGNLNTHGHNTAFQVQELKFPDQIEKKQTRIQGVSRQRLDDEKAKIELLLIFDEMEFKDISKVNLQVRREVAVPNDMKLYKGAVTLHPIQFVEGDDNPKTVVVHAHLENLVADDYKCDMYALSKQNKQAQRNKHNDFIVEVEVIFYDAPARKVQTKSFHVTGNRVAEKRSASDSPESVYSRTAKSERLTPPRMFDSIRSPNENTKFPTYQRIVCDIIEARQGMFANLKANIIKSGNGDIAYHFVLKDQTETTQYKPGEIVGFSTNPQGKVVIEHLSPSNARQTFLKGVVTESQYIEANLPKDQNVITATICMLGVVPVRVMGPVLPGEGLFACEQLPGTAVSEKFVSCTKTEALIGYAFERVDCYRDDVNDVQGLVSIIGCAGQDLVVRQLSTLENSLKHTITYNTKRSRKCFTLLATLLLLLVAAVGTTVYQLKAPGTIYQKYICEQGNVGTVTYWYWGQGAEYFGYQFKSCKEVWNRAISKRKFFKHPHSKHTHPICINETTSSGAIIKFNYYINLDSCAGEVVYGSRYMFAVDEHCDSLWLFDELYGRWRKDENVCNIKCKNKRDIEKGVDGRCVRKAI